MSIAQIKTRHAVVTASELLWIENNAWCVQPLSHEMIEVAEMIDTCYQRRLSHMWLYEHEMVNLLVNDEFDIKPHYSKGILISITGRRKGQHNVNIMLRKHTRWYGTRKKLAWLYEASPKQMLVAIDYLEKALNVSIGGSPSSAGWRIIERCNEKHQDRLAPPQVDLYGCHFGEGSFNLVASRPLLSKERKARYLHKFDMNSAYLYGGGTNDSLIGVGTPVHVFHGQDLVERRKVGIWRCEVETPPASTLLFPLVDGGEMWACKPIIRLLRSTGHKVNVKEGHVFQESALTLKEFSTFLWDKRQLLSKPSDEYRRDECRLMACAGVKQMAVTTLGVTLYDEFADGERKRRPDINDEVVGRTTELIYHIIERVQTQDGVSPVIAYMDAVYYAGNFEDGRQLVPSLIYRNGESREEKLGGFKYEGRIEITPEVISVLEDDMAVSLKLQQLNKIGWVK